MQLIPLFEKIVVEPLETSAVTKGGIVLPEAAHEGPQRGKVVVVGKGPLASNGDYGPMPVAAGDEVVYERDSAREIEIEGKSFWVVQLRSIIGIVVR